ncbi:hypothetical protein [Leeia sp.]|uniref:hypothetical protein n=1 Tax=Leeia sp. TaxID=2884678 RepID=UPI0035B109ED
MNTRTLPMTALLISSLVALSTAHAASAPVCPFSADELKAQLGQTFAAGTPGEGIIGKGCVYKGKDLKLLVDAGPLPAPTAEQWRKMSTPPGTQWKAAAGDPNKALHEIPPAGVSPFPNISYERSGWLVNVRVLGVAPAAVADWNKKLLKLRRIP